MRHRFLCLSVLALACLACGASAAEDLTSLEQVADAVERASPEMKSTLLANGVSVAAKDGGWRIGSCGDAFDVYAKASAEVRDTLIAEAFDSCTQMCPGGSGRNDAFEAAAKAPRATKTALIVSACDEAGLDPVFGGEWKDQRNQMGLMDYWVQRAMFATVFDRLDGIGGAKSEALRARYEGLRDSVAAQLVLANPPMDARLAESTAERRVLPAPVVRVTTKDVLVDNTSVGGQGFQAALRSALTHRQSETPAEERDRVLLQVDNDVPYSRLATVMGVADQAGSKRMELAVLNPRGQRFIALSMPPLGAPVGGDRDRPLDLTIEISDTGFQIRSTDRGRDAEIPCLVMGCPDAAAYDAKELTRYVGALKDAHPDDMQVIVLPQDAIHHGVVVKALDATREDVTYKVDGRTRVLFPDAILARVQ